MDTQVYQEYKSELEEYADTVKEGKGCKEWICKEKISVDKGLKNIISDLNKLDGITTSSSCSGLQEDHFGFKHLPQDLRSQINAPLPYLCLHFRDWEFKDKFDREYNKIIHKKDRKNILQDNNCFRFYNEECTPNMEKKGECNVFPFSDSELKRKWELLKRDIIKANMRIA